MIRDHETVIKEAITESYSDAMKCENPRGVRYRLYIWEDGKIERLFSPAGSCEGLGARDNEPRELYFVGDVYGEEIPDEWTAEEMVESFDPDPLFEAFLLRAEENERWRESY